MLHQTVLGGPSRAKSRLLAAGIAVSALAPVAALPATSGADPSPDSIVQRTGTGPVETSSLAGTTGSNDTGGNDGGLSTGAVVAIVGGGLVVLGAAGTAVRYRVRLRGTTEG